MKPFPSKAWIGRDARGEAWLLDQAEAQSKEREGWEVREYRLVEPSTSSRAERDGR